MVTGFFKLMKCFTLISRDYKWITQMCKVESLFRFFKQLIATIIFLPLFILCIYLFILILGQGECTLKYFRKLFLRRYVSKPLQWLTVPYVIGALLTVSIVASCIRHAEILGVACMGDKGYREQEQEGRKEGGLGKKSLRLWYSYRNSLGWPMGNSNAEISL